MKKNRDSSKRVIYIFLAILLVCGMFFAGMTKIKDEPWFWAIMFATATMAYIIRLTISEVKAPTERENDQPTTPPETEESPTLTTPESFPVEDDNPTAKIIPVEGSKEAHYDCGHSYPINHMLHLYGEEIEPTDEALADRTMCPECRLTEVMSEVIRCGLCGRSIWPADQVARCEDRPGLKIGKVYCGDMVVICLRPGCAPAGMMMGEWDGKMVIPLEFVQLS